MSGSESFAKTSDGVSVLLPDRLDTGTTTFHFGFETPISGSRVDPPTTWVASELAVALADSRRLCAKCAKKVEAWVRVALEVSSATEIHLPDR